MPPYTDAAFLAELSEGQAWERWVIEYLRLSGLPVVAPPQSVRERREDAPAYRDSVDCRVGPYRLEIKSRRQWFTSPADLPYREFLVDTVAKWDSRDPTPLAMIVVSRETGAMVCVTRASQSRWTVLTRADPTRGLEAERFYAADARDWRPVGDLVRWLRQRQ